MHRSPDRRLLGRIVLSLAGAFLLEPAAGWAHAPSGAIFTTTETGDRVNANLFERGRDVFLDGGPGPNAPRAAAGLDPGLYVFQVTDSSGRQLLSQDSAKCRVVLVEESSPGVGDGVIVARMEWDGSGGAGSDFTRHTNGNDGCHRRNRHEESPDLDYGSPAVVVQLMPYTATRDRRGVYKVWVTPLQDFMAACAELNLSPNQALARADCGSPEDAPGNFHGFLPRHSKTDNFKVAERRGRRPPAQEILVEKFCDSSCNGVRDVGVDPCLDAVQISVTAADGTSVCSGLTEGGYFSCYPPDPGSYTVAETIGGGLAVCGARVDGVGWGRVERVTVTAGDGNLDPLLVEFGNTAADGRVDVTRTCFTSGEPIGGMWVELTGTDLLQSTVSDAAMSAPDGVASFENLMAGSYTVTDLSPPNLVPIGPTTCEVDLAVDTSLDPGTGLAQCTAGSATCDLQYAAVGDIGARTPGFWCNQSLREAGQHDPDGHNPGENAACFRQLQSTFEYVQTIIEHAFAYWLSLGGDRSFFDLSGDEYVDNAESQQILCPQLGDAEHHQCRRQLFALLENVVGQIAESNADSSIGCGRIGVADDQAIVVDGQLWTVGGLLERVLYEGCTPENHLRIQAVNENTSTLLDECPAALDP